VRGIAKAAFFTALVWTSLQHRRLEAIARWWGWQIWRRITHQGLDVEMPGGAWLWCPPWSDIGGMVVATGSNEPAEFGLLVRWIRPGDLVIDVGANIGVYTIAFAGLGAHVAAIEPSASAQRALERSIRRNALSDLVRVFASALSNHEGQASFTVGHDVGNRLIEDGEVVGESTLVSLSTLGVLVRDPFFDRPLALLKVDAEGADLMVLEGGLEILARDRPMVMVEAWGRDSDTSKFLERLGYHPWQISPNSWDLEEILDGGTRQNLIFIHPDRLAETLLRLATPLDTKELPSLRLARR
jgi:FkbM family methyltransferase